VKEVPLVEDDVSLVRYVEFELFDAGYRVTTARTVGEAWKTVRSQPFDGAVVDIHLPGAFGWELIERMRRDPSLRDLPVIVYSGSEPGSDVKAEQLGCEFIPKPFEAAVLIEKLERLTARPAGAAAWVEKRSIRASVLTNTLRFDGTIHVPPGPGRFSDAVDDILTDERAWIPMTDVTMTTLGGAELGRDDYVQVLKASVTAIFPL